mmetsp:Transcript_38460/g.96752  ORF Transcript_38460/g.96752 Transcript_38460/m.96752 type:complete len:1041 (+) Transcript_38460:293-3415(+)
MRGQHITGDTMPGLWQLGQKFFDCKITGINNDLIPASPSSRDRLDIAHVDHIIVLLSLDGWERFEQLKGTKTKVHVATEEDTHITAVHDLEHFQFDQTSNHCSGGCNCRNDLTSNHLGAMTSSRFDLIVPRAHVGAGGGKVNVEVGIIILLKVVRLNRLDRRMVKVLEEGDQFLVLLLLEGHFVILLFGLLFLLVVHAHLLRLPVGHRAAGLGKLGTEGGVVTHRIQAEHEREEVGRTVDVLEVELVVQVELGGTREALGTAPERRHHTSVLVLLGGVGRELVLQVLDTVAVLLVELGERQADARTKVGTDRVAQQGHHGTEALQTSADVALVLHLLEEAGRVGEQQQCVAGRILKVLGELSARPLDAVFDDVGEVAQRAHRDAVLVLGVRVVTVALRLVRYDDLAVGLGAERATLQQRLLVEDATRVHVATGGHVVEGVAHAVQRVPEGVVKVVLAVGADQLLVALNVHLWIHDACRVRGAHTLLLADVLLAEEELTVQVAHLDAIHVRDVNGATVGAHTHQRKALQVLAAERTTAHHEPDLFAQLLLEGGAQHRDLVIVARADRRGVRRHVVAEQLKVVDVEPLVRGRVLAELLDHLLRGHAAQEGTHATELGARVQRHVAHGLLAQLVDDERSATLLLLRAMLCQEALGQHHALVGVRLVVQLGQCRVLGLELPERQTGKVQLVAGGVHNELHAVRMLDGELALLHRVHQRLGERAEGHDARRLHLGHVAAASVRRELGHVQVGVLLHELEVEAVRNEALARLAVLGGVAAVHALDGALHLVQLHHAVDVLELDQLAFVKAVRLLGHLEEQSRHGARGLTGALLHLIHLDERQRNVLERLAVRVRDPVLGAKVREEAARHTVGERQNEGDAVGVTKVVPAAQLGQRTVHRHDDRTPLGQLLGAEAVAASHTLRYHAHHHVRVQHLQLRLAHLIARLANTVGVQVKVAALVGHHRRLRVEETDRRRTGQHQVLGCLHTHATQAHHQHSQGSQTFHRFQTIGADLSRIQVHQFVGRVAIEHAVVSFTGHLESFFFFFFF